MKQKLVFCTAHEAQTKNKKEHTDFLFHAETLLLRRAWHVTARSEQSKTMNSTSFKSIPSKNPEHTDLLFSCGDLGTSWQEASSSRQCSCTSQFMPECDVQLGGLQGGRKVTATFAPKSAVALINGSRPVRCCCSSRSSDCCVLHAGAVHLYPGRRPSPLEITTTSPIPLSRAAAPDQSPDVHQELSTDVEKHRFSDSVRG